MTLTGAAMPPLPVVAVAGLDQAVQQTQLVTLDGGGSTGPVTGFTWAQTAGPAVVLSAPGAPVATFTAPGVAGPLTFALTVTGEGGPSSDEVTVQVSPVVALTADAGPGRAARLGERVTLDGTGSTGVAAFNWAQISGPPAVPIDAAGTATPAFPMPGGDVVLRLTAAGPAGPDVTSDVTITATPYVVTVQTAQFRTGRSEWRITGTATGALPDQVTVSFGGSVLGSSPVDATGAWDLRRTVLASEPALRPFPPASVTVTTTRGANQVVPVNIRS